MDNNDIFLDSFCVARLIPKCNKTMKAGFTPYFHLN